MTRTSAGSLYTYVNGRFTRDKILLRAVTQLTCTYPGFMDESADSAEPQDELLSVVLDRDRPGSVAASAVVLELRDAVNDYYVGNEGVFTAPVWPENSRV